MHRPPFEGEHAFGRHLSSQRLRYCAPVQSQAALEASWKHQEDRGYRKLTSPIGFTDSGTDAPLLVGESSYVACSVHENLT